MEVNKKQLDLMKHTVNGPGRNWFATSKNCNDAVEFDKIVKMGFATSCKAASWMGDDVIYSLTKDGKDYVNFNGG